MTIYVDQMFLENFIMNFLILYITSKFSGVCSTWYRVSIGASIGAIYVILSYIGGFYSEPYILPKILLSCIIVFSSFKIKSIRMFFKSLLFFYGVTFFIGGVSLGLSDLLNVSIIEDGGVIYVEEFPVMMVAFGCMMAVIIGKWSIMFLKNKVNLDEFLYKMKIRLFNKEIFISVLMDSGNSVKEPFTGYPVLIVEKDILKEIIPEDIIFRLDRNDFELDDVWRKRIRLIPISTVNSECEMKMGVKIDEAVVYVKGEERNINNLIVVGCDRKLSKDDVYHALIGNIF